MSYVIGLDVQVGSVLGRDNSTRELYAIHRNQKSYLMYHSTYKKWLTITNEEFVKNVSNNIQMECKLLGGINEQVFTIENQQWMGKCF